MPKIVRITPIESIKPGRKSAILEDHTIENPEPYHAADVEFDDGTVVQVERPLTQAKIQAAFQEVQKAAATQAMDGIEPGQVV